MNSTFKVVFNKARGALMVVNEVTSSVQAKGTKTVVATAVAAMIAGVAGTAVAETMGTETVKPAIDRVIVQKDTVVEGKTFADNNYLSEFGKSDPVDNNPFGGLFFVDRPEFDAEHEDATTVIKLTVKSSTFDNNTTDGVGAAIVTRTTKKDSAGKPYYGSLEVEDTTFKNNHAKEDGGALGNYGAMKVSGSTFEGNTAWLAKDEEGNYTVVLTPDEDATPIGGGAISLGAVSSTQVGSIENTTFTGNRSGYNGGAIGTRLGKDAHNIGAKLDISADFTSNEAHLDGGAIYNTFYTDNGLKKGAGVTVTGSFTGNKAGQSGGAIFNDGAKDQDDKFGGVMTVTDSTFKNNVAKTNGGAIASTGTITVAGTTTFEGNTAAQGGAIYIASKDGSAGKLTLNATDADDVISFKNNVAKEEGAGSDLHLVGATVDLTGKGTISFEGSIAGDANSTITSDVALVKIADASNYKGSYAFNKGVAEFGELNVEDELSTGNNVSLAEPLKNGVTAPTYVDGAVKNGVVAENATFNGATVTIGRNNNIEVTDTLTLKGTTTVGQAEVPTKEVGIKDAQGKPVQKVDGTGALTVEVAYTGKGVGTLTAGTIKVSGNGESAVILNTDLAVSAKNLVIEGTKSVAPVGGQPGSNGKSGSLKLQGSGSVTVAEDIELAGVTDVGANGDRRVGLTINMDAVPDVAGKDRVYNFVAEKGLTVGNLGTLTLTKGNVKVGENLMVAKGGKIAGEAAIPEDREIASTTGILDIGGTLDIAKGATVDLKGVTVTADKLVNAAGTYDPDAEEEEDVVALGTITVANGGSNSGYIKVTNATIGGTFENQFIKAESEDDADEVGTILGTSLTIDKKGVFNNAGVVEVDTLTLGEGAVIKTALKNTEGTWNGDVKTQPKQVKSYTKANTVTLNKNAVFDIAEKNHITEIETVVPNSENVYSYKQDGIQLDGTWTLNGGTITLAGESIANEDVWVNGDLTIQNGSDVEVNRLNIVTNGSVTVGFNGELTFNNAFGISDSYVIGYKNPDDEEGHAVDDTDFAGLAGNNGIVYVTIENKNALDFDKIVGENADLGAAGTAISNKFGLTGNNKGLVFVEGLKVKAPAKNEITKNQAVALGGLVIEGLDGLTVTGVTTGTELKGSFGSIKVDRDFRDSLGVNGILVLNGAGALVAKVDGDGKVVQEFGIELGATDSFIYDGGENEATLGAITGSGNVDVATGVLTVKGDIAGNNLYVGDADDEDVGALTVNGNVVVTGGAEVDAGSKLTVNGNVTAGNPADKKTGTLVVGGDVVVNTAAGAEEAATVTANAIRVNGGSITTGKDVALNVADAIEVADGKITAGDVNVSGYWVVRDAVTGNAIAGFDHVLDKDVALSFNNPATHKVEFVEAKVTLDNAEVKTGDLTVAGNVALTNGKFDANSVDADAVAANGTTVKVTEAIVANEVEGLNASIGAGSINAGTAIVQNGSLTAGTVVVTSLNAANVTTNVEELTAETAVIAGGSLEAGEVTVGQATLVGTTATIGTLTGDVNVGRDDFKANLYVTNFADGVLFSDPAFGESGKMTFAEANNVAIGTVGGFAHLARGTVAVIGQATMEGVADKLASVGVTELEQNKVDSALVVIGGTTNTGSVRLDNATEVGSSTGALVTSATTALVIDGASFAEAPALFEEGNIELNGVTYITDAKAGTTIQLTGNGQILGNGAINTDVNRVFNADKEGGALVVNVKNDMGVLEDLVAIDAVKSYYGEAYGNGGNATFVEGMLGNANTMTDREIVQAMNEVAGIGATAGMASVTMDALSAFNDIVANRTSILAPAAEGTALWADVQAGRYEAKRLMNGAGYSSDIYAGAFGVDTVVSCGAKIGAAFTFGNADTDSKNTTAVTSMDSDFVGFSVYTAKQFGEANVAVDLGYLKASNDVSAKAFNLGKFSADSDAITFGVRGELLTKAGSFNVVPHAGLRWTKLSVDSFEAGYKTDIDDMNVFQLPVGVTVSGEFEAAGWNFAPAFDLSFVPAFGDKDADMTLGIAGATQTTSYGVQVIDSNPVQATIGLDATNGAWGLGLNYKLGAGSDGRMNNAFNVNVRYTF